MKMFRMLVCPKCNGQGYIEKYGKSRFDSSATNMKCDKCGGVGSIPLPITNGDLIRSMNDSALAEVICCPYDIDPDICNKKIDCLSCCEEWLKQPIERED